MISCVRAIIWRALINFLIVQIDSRKQEVPQKKSRREQTSHVEGKTHEVSWISPTKVRVSRKKVADRNHAVKSDPRSHATWKFTMPF